MFNVMARVFQDKGLRQFDRELLSHTICLEGGVAFIKTDLFILQYISVDHLIQLGTQ